jgi:hypothetical protein
MVDQSTGYIYIIAICTLYFAFFHKLSYWIFEDNTICDQANYTLQRECVKQHKEIVNSNVFKMLIVLGVAGLVLSAYSESVNISTAIALGSLLLILEGIFMHWSDLGEGHKLIIIFLSLCSMLYTSHKLYKGEPVSDILTGKF